MPWYWGFELDGYKYSPSQPRVPAGNPEGGQWTIGTAQMAAIIFNETRSLSSTAAADINHARMKIAHMVNNGERRARHTGSKRPRTANDFIAGRIPSVEARTYADILKSVEKAKHNAENGIDPTGGAIYMYLADNPTYVRYGTFLFSEGPFRNSFPNTDVPSRIVYINFSK